ncbi:MAG: ATP-binding protein [Prevotella sp.]|nr:ATP-binding protein [Prevotella sp.]
MMKNNAQAWLGLAPYEEKDAHLFFGRTAEIEELFNDIKHNTQTVIYGPSGTGKTSIIKAGIFGEARKENFLPVYIRLLHDTDESYALQTIRNIEENIKAIGGEIENNIPPIDPNTQSLWEYLHINSFWSKDNYPLVPLLVIDQFEEIFTLAKDRERVAAFFEKLSDLCDNKMPDYVRRYLNENAARSKYPEKVNYRIVISLREDFLARLEEQACNIPSLRRNRFSLQAINEEQAMEIIMKPGEGIVTEEVAIEIIKKLANNDNFKIDGIPEITLETSLLSLFCNELNKKRIERGEKFISMELVSEFGDNIIADFYDGTMGKVSPDTVTYLEKALLTGNGYRDSVAYADAEENGVTRDELDILQSNRIIRMDEWDGTRRIEFTHDVLCKVAKERRDERKKILQLKEEEERSRKLESALADKRKKNKLLALVASLFFLLFVGLIVGYQYLYVWEYSEYYESYVKRYGFPAGVGKEMSKADRESTAVYFKLSRKGRWGNNSRFTQMEAYNAYGKPTTGHNVASYLVDLSEDDEDRKLRSENGELKWEDETAIAFSKKLKTVYRWDFVPDAQGNIAQEIAYATDGSVVFVFTISRSSSIEKENVAISNDNNKNNKNVAKFAEVKKEEKNKGVTEGSVFWAIYTDEKGKPLKLRENGADRVRITYDSDGFAVQTLFYNSQGMPRQNYDEAYGQRYEYDKETGCCLSYGSTDEFGDYMLDRVGNSGMRHWYDERCRPVRVEAFGADGEPVNTKYKYGVVEYAYPDDNTTIQTYYDKDGDRVATTDSDSNNEHICEITKDARGNVVCVKYKGIDGKLLDSGYAIINMQYDSNGNQTLREFLSADGEPYENEYFYSKLEYEFTADNLPKEERFSRRIGDSIFVAYRCTHQYDDKGNETHQYVYDVDNEITEYYVSRRYDSNGTLTERAYYNSDMEPIEAGYGGYHKFVSETTQLNDSAQATVEKYFDADNNPLYNADMGYAKDSAVYVNGNMISYTQFDGDGDITSSHIYGYDSFGNRTSQAEMGIFGTPVRWGRYDAIIYYKVKIYTDFNNNDYYKFENEFGEQGVATDKDEKPFTSIWQKTYFTKFNYKGKEYEMRTDSLSLGFLKELFPLVIGLQVESKQTNAYTCGLKDGDILVEYGEWKYSFDNPNIAKLLAERDRLASQKKQIKIVRHYPEKKASEAKTITLPEGPIGIRLIQFYYTQKEKERLMKYL